MVDPLSVIQGLSNGQDEAASRAIADLDQDPDAAARAASISRGTGVSPGVVLADPEGFERDRKAKLTGEIVRNNPAIASYIQNHPMASKVSNDDYDALDRFTQSILHFHHDPLKAAWEGFKEGWGEEPLGSASGLGSEMAKNPGLTSYIRRLSPSVDMGMDMLSTELDALGRLPGAVINGGAAGAAQLAKQLGMSETSANQLQRDINTYAQGMAGEMGMGHMVEGVHQKYGDPIAIAKPYIERGEMPPTGLHPDIDALKGMQAKLDAESLNSALKEAQGSKTRERSPEAFKAFVDSQVQDRKISISADAVRQLYGEKGPEIEDGILGWVPRINEQLELAQETGGDIEIPLSDWLAKVEPQVAKALQEDIRVRKGGMTLREASEAQEFAMIDAWHGTRHGGIEGFKDEAIGTGEGSQAYGHGHYVAESRGVAKSYRTAGLDEDPTKLILDQVKNDPELGPKLQASERAMNDVMRGFEDLHERSDRMSQLDYDKENRDLNAQLDHLSKQHEELINQAKDKYKVGSLYRVRIDAEPEHFLDWDKRLSEQSPYVQETLKKVLDTSKHEHSHGKVLYSLLSTPDREAASKALKEAGIAGNRYLDQGSRGLKTRAEIEARLKGIEDDIEFLKKEEAQPSTATLARGPIGLQLMDLDEERGRLQGAKSAEEATYNYVVFDPSKIEITHENEIARARAEAHLKPIFEARGAPIELKHINRDFEGYDTFELHSAGSRVGDMVGGLSKDGKEFYVEGIQTHDWKGANLWGPTIVRDMAYQLKRHYPELERVTGFRVTGGRAVTGKMGEKITLDINKLTLGKMKDFASAYGWDVAETASDMLKGLGTPEQLLARGTAKGWNRLTEEMQGPINDILQKMAPRADIRGYEYVTAKDRIVRGVFTIDPETLKSVVAWAARGEDSITTGRHEVVHYLRQVGFITEREWSVLEETSRREDWITRHNIDDRYQGASLGLKLEESIAEEFGHWNGGPHVAGGVFDRIKEFLKRVRDALSEFFGGPVDANEIFRRIESGEVGAREPTRQPEGSIYNQEMAQEPPLVDKAKTFGMTEAQYKNYLKAIEAVKKEDLEYQLRKSEKKLSKEWRAKEKEVRDEVTQNVQNRPDLLADNMLGKSRGGFKLDGKKVPEALRKDLDPYIGKNGVDPDQIAGLFGYTSGEAMMNNLSILQNARKKMPKADYEKGLIEREVERQMERRFGNLEENILQDARDHVTNDAQSDLLAQEIQILAVQHGLQEPPIKGDELKAWVKDKFDFIPVEAAIDLEGHLQNAGKAGRAAELTLLKGDPAEALRQKQRQQLSFLIAKESKKLLKEYDKATAFMKRFASREVTGVGQEYTNFIHQIMLQVGQRVKRSVQDLSTELGGKTLQEFVSEKLGEYKEVSVWDELYNQNFRTPMDQLQAWEFRAVHDSLQSLAHNGRLENKIFRGQNAAEIGEVATKAVEQMETFKAKIRPLGKRKLRDLGSVVLAAHLKMEQLFDRWDRDDPHGVFNSYAYRALSEAKNHEYGLEKEIGRRLSTLKDYGHDLNKVLENTVFMDPMTGDPLPGFTRKNLRAVMLNMGNESNLMKLAKGYKIDNPQMIWDFVHRHATKGDWDYVQGIWDTFARLKSESDQMYRRLSGIAPESIEHRPVDTPFKQYKGGYYPLVYDPVRSDIKQRIERDPLEKDGYYKATTPKGYTIKRTGYVAPIDLNLDVMPQKFKQIIHDIAFREALINAQKLLSHKDVRAAIAKHFGPDYRDLINPWLKDIASYRNATDDVGKRFAEWSAWFRQNTVATLVGFNPGTILKHGPTAFLNSLNQVGAANFMEALRDITGTAGRADSSAKFAMDNSQELQHRMRNWTETIAVGHDTALKESESWRDKWIRLGAYGVGKSDMFSAVPTWLAAYKKAMLEGESHSDAVYIAEKSVRQAHGSVGITDRARVQRGGEAMKWVASLYGFFNHILNRQVDMVWKAGDALGKLKEGDRAGALKDVPMLTSKLFYYVIFPAVVEELVTPLSNDKHESWAKLVGKALLKQVSASWIGARDLVQALVSGQDPTSSLLNTDYKAITDVAKDIEKHGLFHGPKWFQHASTAVGTLWGIGGTQAGRWGQFAINYSQGKEHVRNLGQAARALRYGTTKGPGR